MVESQRRMVRGRRVIAVTGSAGKTSTTAMLAHALRALADGAKVQYDARNRMWSSLLRRFLVQSRRGTCSSSRVPAPPA
ncbi:hypothetical protein D3250_09915 [Nesterenkonia natronophila]|uniref:Uncharacterized protein n=1 Tax=Nesterenkonia natronophila TaxID=2174932 RepID=A0A3A4FFV5_9MICC|nr:hypothetical protein D3250_09915 [Nesterenkonia natronophila]